MRIFVADSDTSATKSLIDLVCEVLSDAEVFVFTTISSLLEEAEKTALP